MPCWRPLRRPGGAVSLTLFNRATETVTNVGASGGGTLGTQVTVSRAVPLNALWLYSPSGQGLTGVPGTIGLFTVSGTTLVHSETATWSGAAGSGWIRAAFAAPPVLAAGAAYQVAVFDSSATAVWFIYNTGGWPAAVVNRLLSAPAGSSQGWYSTATTGITYPSSQLSGYNWYLDAEAGQPFDPPPPARTRAPARKARTAGTPAARPAAAAGVPAPFRLPAALPRARPAARRARAAGSAGSPAAVPAPGAYSPLLLQDGTPLLLQDGTPLLAQGSGQPPAVFTPPASVTRGRPAASRARLRSSAGSPAVPPAVPALFQLPAALRRAHQLTRKARLAGSPGAPAAVPASPFRPPARLTRGTAAARRGRTAASPGSPPVPPAVPAPFTAPAAAWRARQAARRSRLAGSPGSPAALPPVTLAPFTLPPGTRRAHQLARKATLGSSPGSPAAVPAPAAASPFTAPPAPRRGRALARRARLGASSGSPPVTAPAASPFTPPAVLRRGRAAARKARAASSAGSPPAVAPSPFRLPLVLRRGHPAGRKARLGSSPGAVPAVPPAPFTAPRKPARGHAAARRARASWSPGSPPVPPPLSPALFRLPAVLRRGHQLARRARLQSSPGAPASLTEQDFLLDEAGDGLAAQDSGALLEESGDSTTGATDGLLLDEAGDGLLAEDGGNLLGEGPGGTTGGGSGGGGPVVSTPPLATFPDQALGLAAELLTGSTWTDVTGDWDHGPAAISRGHPDESTTVAPSTLSGLNLTNTSGRYSPDNAMSDLWPHLVQNTPVRISIPAETPYLRLEADADDRAYVNETGNLDIAGSLEARIALRLSDWQGCVLAGKCDGANPSWYWVLNPDATMTFGWWDSGGTLRTATSPQPVPYLPGPMVLVAYLDATTSTAYFWAGPGEHADDTAGVGYLGGVTYGTASSVRTGTAPLVIGWSTGNVASHVQMLGRVLEFKLYAIGRESAAAVADAVFTSQSPGAASWTDQQGNLWQLAGGAEVSGRDYRFHGECAEFPQEQATYEPDEDDGTGPVTLATVPVEGGGLLRRYSQRNAPVNSAMYRAVTRQAGALAPAAYWPLEDGAGATQLGSALAGPPMSINGTPALASDSTFTASNPLPVLNGAVLSGQVPAYASNGSAVTRFLAKVGTLPGASYATLARVSTSGTVRALYVIAYADGGLGLIGYDYQGNTVVNTGDLSWVAGGVSGHALWYSVELQPVSGGVQVSLETLAPGATVGTGHSLVLAGATVGTVTEVTVNPNGFFTDTVAGHVSVQSAWVYLFSLGGALNGWQLEPAGARFARLCAEEGIPCRTRGNLAATTLMGAQTPQTLAQLLQACADADQGIWYEPRQVLGWGYITRRALYGQPATAAVTYDEDILSLWSSPPTRDDQVIVNDVTYQNASGSSARQYAAPGQPVPGGRMSVLPPAQGGVGTYDQSYPVAIGNDSDLGNLAGWKLHLGTVDQSRYPGIVFDLANRAAAAVTWDVLDLELGDRLTIDGQPPRLGYDQVTQLAQQLEEVLWNYDLQVTVTGVPELPYQVAQAGAAHLDTAGTQLGGPVDATAGSVQLVSSGLPWSASTADYPLNVMCEGELMTVTAVSGAASPQAASVTRSVNGVSKPHPAGAAVSAWPPVTVGL